MMLNFSFYISNPNWDRQEPLIDEHFSLSENWKLYFYVPVPGLDKILDIQFWAQTGDHRGVGFTFIVLGVGFEIELYDKRHEEDQ